MKIAFFFIFFTFYFNAQKVIPFEDFNNYFRTFQEGDFRVLEFQRIQDYKAGDEFTAYIDNRVDLVLVNGTEKVLRKKRKTLSFILLIETLLRERMETLTLTHL